MKHYMTISTSETAECLYASTADRAKLSVLNTMSRIRGRGTSLGYPQTEGMLGDCMSHYGQELGAASEFGTMSASTPPADRSCVSMATVKHGGKCALVLDGSF